MFRYYKLILLIMFQLMEFKY